MSFLGLPPINWGPKQENFSYHSSGNQKSEMSARLAPCQGFGETSVPLPASGSLRWSSCVCLSMSKGSLLIRSPLCWVRAHPSDVTLTCSSASFFGSKVTFKSTGRYAFSILFGGGACCWTHSNNWTVSFRGSFYEVQQKFLKSWVTYKSQYSNNTCKSRLY